MKLKIAIIAVVITILIMPIKAFAITEQDNQKIQVTPVTGQNFEALWLRGFDIKGYRTIEKQLISSTHNNLGYHVFLNVNGKNGEMSGKTSIGKEKMEAMHYKEVQNDKTQNIDGIDLLVTTKYLNQGNQVQVIYTLKNTTKEEAEVSLGTSADVEIDGDDKSIIEQINNGEKIKLYTNKGKTKKEVQFVLYAKNTKGVTNVDNMWIGGWNDYYLSHIFDTNMGTQKIENIDSAIAFSWVNRKIKSGETKTYSVIMEIGESNQIKEEDNKEDETKPEDNEKEELNTEDNNKGNEEEIKNENTQKPEQKEEIIVEEKQPNTENSKIEKELSSDNETQQQRAQQHKEQDNTVAKTKLPQTGENENILFLIAILLIRTIYIYRKLRKIKKQELTQKFFIKNS